MAEHVTSEESELYALGVLDGDERQAFEAHLLACGECTRGVASAHQRVALIGLACVPETPRPAVREKIMRRILAERAGSWTQEKAAQLTELRVEREPEPEPEVKPKSKAKPEPVAVAEPEEIEGSYSLAEAVGERPVRRVQWLAAGVAALLLMGISVGVWAMHRSHQKQVAQLPQTQESQQNPQPAPAAQNDTVSAQKGKAGTNANRAVDTAAIEEEYAAETSTTARAARPETLTLGAPARIASTQNSDAAPPPSLALAADMGHTDALPALPGAAPEPRVEPAGPSGPMRVSSGVAAARLISPIQATYPDLAREARVQGSVVVAATITTTGRIKNAHAVSGPALLTAAAVSAVQRARYRPFALNGVPVEAETTITLVFKLAN